MDDDDEETRRLEEQFNFVDIGVGEDVDVIIPVDEPVQKSHFVISSIVIGMSILGILAGVAAYICKFHSSLMSLQKLKKLISSTDSDSVVKIDEEEQ